MEATVPKNTANLVTQAASAPARRSAKLCPVDRLKGILSVESVRKQFEDVLKENASAFVASIIDMYNTDRYLQACDPEKVVIEALKAATLKLPINKQLGFAYIVPYKGVPQFQLGYKGLIQLSQRTGAYKHINAGTVYEGEFVGCNKLTGAVDLSGVRSGNAVIGYFAYIETLNGFQKALYWTKDEVTAHAQRYSKSFASSTSTWASNFDEMAIKTVLRNLLSKYGIMSVEFQTAMESEQVTVLADEHIGAPDFELMEIVNISDDNAEEAQ